MAIYGDPGSATYAVSIDNLEGMLGALPDNTTNQINARDLRDVVSGLWKITEGLSDSIANAYQFNYSTSSTTPISIGGWPQGSTFNNVSLQQLFDTLFFPYIQPQFSLSLSPSVLEFGNTASTTSINWNIQAKTKNINSAQIQRPNGALLLPNPSANTTSNGSVTGIPIPNIPTTFTMSVNDGSQYSSTAQLTWSLRRWWGSVDSSNPLSEVNTSTISQSDLSGLNSELNSGFVQTRIITATNSYVIFVWPSSNNVNLSQIPPRVTIGGFANNDWTRTRTGVTLINSFGYTASYDVWRFNQLQTSTLQYTIN